jgi:hypothetical protein
MRNIVLNQAQNQVGSGWLLAEQQDQWLVVYESTPEGGWNELQWVDLGYWTAGRESHEFLVSRLTYWGFSQDAAWAATDRWVKKVRRDLGYHD